MVYLILWLMLCALKLPLYSFVIILIAALAVAPRGQRRFILYGLLLALVIVDLQGFFLHYNDRALPPTVRGYVYHIVDDKADVYIDNQKYRLKGKGLYRQLEGQCIELNDVSWHWQRTRNRHSYDYQRHYQLLGYSGYLKARVVGAVEAPADLATRRWAQRVRQHVADFSQKLPAPADVLIEALLLGEMRDGRLLERVKALGLLHLFVISGFHFAIIAALLFFVLHRLLRLPYRWAIVAVAIASIFYLAIIKVGFGSMRAAFALIVSFSCFGLKRKPDGVRIALIYVLLMLSINVAVLFDLGFQLTVSSYLAVALTSRQLRRWPMMTTTLQVAVISAVVFACIAGILVYNQGVVALSGLLLIPLLTPLVGGFIVLSCIGLLLDAFGMAAYCIWPLHFLAARIYQLISWFEGLAQLNISFAPLWAIVSAVVLIIGLAAHLLTNRGWRLSSGLALGLLISGLVLFGQVQGGLTINSYALYDGEAYLIRAPGAVVLYDVGNSPEIIDMLRRSGVDRIDAIIISHAHRDHIGMLAPICRQFDVRRVIVDMAAERQSLVIGSLNMTLYRAPAGLSDNLNDRSIACHLRYGQFDMLLTGDMEEASTAWLVERLGSLPVEVLKMPHHGSYNAYLPDLLAISRARAAIIAGGNGKRIDKTDVVQLLRESQIDYCDAMYCGKICIRVNRAQFEIDTVEQMRQIVGDLD